MHPWEYENLVVKSFENPEFQDETACKNVMKRLRAGNVMKKFSGTTRKNKSEDRTFYVKVDTRQIIWSKNQVLEGYIDIREIKELRQGKDSVDFERLQDESRRVDSTLCFSIFYGNEFNLKVMSVAAQNHQDVDVWVRGVNYLVCETLKAPYPLQVKWWLRKEFDQISHKEQVSQKAAKAWLPNIHVKSLSTKTLKELFHELDTRRKGWIGFEQFVKFYYDVMFHAQKEILDLIIGFSEDKLSFSSMSFQKFLVQEQKETWAEDSNNVKTFLSKFHGFPDSRVEPLSKAEMIAYLFSKENSIWDQQKLKLDEETLKKPMSQYWISSSHNTYLTGDQLRSESSCEAYARSLRMGCRCIELDCWDGTNGMPCICHGHTLTTKIPFFDVLKTIKKHAFVVSDLPVILSIENHCSLKQQRHMATMFQDVFGDMLCTKPVTKDDSVLPSPLELKGKIIVKHKKLSDQNRQSEVFNGELDLLDIGDVSNSVKNGLMYMYEPTLKEWNLHYFVLTKGILGYTEEQRPKTAEPQEPLIEEQRLNTVEPQDIQFNTSYTEKTTDITELHLLEKWYHGNIDRQAALLLISDYGNREGSFLVRDSRKVEHGYTLSFVNHGQVQHCLINPEYTRGCTHYYIFKQVYFDSVFSLINYYQSNPMENRDLRLQMILGDPVPPPNFHERMEWFHNDIDRTKAEAILRNIPKDGAFLVRNGRNFDQFAISFHAGNDIKHCKITREDRLYLVGSASFETLVDCVNFYRGRPLFRKIFLSWPVTKEFLSKMSINAEQPIRVRADYDYVRQRDDELSFCKGEIISNVIKEDEGWWRGDTVSQTAGYFPSNYVTELPAGGTNDLPASRENVDNVLGEMQKGAIDLSNSVMELMPESKGHQNFCFRIKTTFSNQMYELATDTKEDLHDWMFKIKAEMDKKDDEAKKKKGNEKMKHIAVELSDLVMYCRPVGFKEDMRRIYSRPAHEMSSFPETKAMQYSCKDRCQTFISYNQRQFSRVYPKGTRVDSSNYNPIPLWNVGSQLVALNFQTCDRPMQFNEARFELNGRCGFVQKPTIFDDTKFNPFLKSNHDNVDPLVINVQIMGARHLPKSGKSLSSPFIEVEIIGCDYDNKKVKTTKKESNVLNLLFMDSYDFTVHNSALAFLRFTVQDQDMFGDPKFLAHATVPVPAIKPGFRSVPLKNEYSEDIELAALLVHIDIRSLKKEDEEKLEVLEQLKDMNRDFQQKLALNDHSSLRYKQLQVQQIELQKKIHSMEMELKNKNQKM